MGKIPSPYITKVIVRTTEQNNEKIYVLQIGAASFYYKLWQTLLQIGQLHYYKLGQVLLQIGAPIRN